MKAIEIIEAMVYDSALAECAGLHTYYGNATVNDWLTMVFGDFRVKAGEIEAGSYLVLWQCDANRFYPFDAENPCDVVLVRNNADKYESDDREVWLWKIDLKENNHGKYSNNKKLNGVLNEIREDLLSIHDTEAESLSEIAHYKRGFPKEVDFNLAQYGNLLIYYDDVRAMYARHGYKSIDCMSDAQVWDTYKRQVGYVAKTL